MLSEFPGKYFLWRPAVHICQLSQTCSETKVTFLKASGLKKKANGKRSYLINCPPRKIGIMS